VEDSSLLNAPARLAKRLLSLATSQGRPTPAGTQLRISQEELSQFLGLSRQIVNRHLQTWKHNHWINLARGIVVVANERALRDLTQQD
jgi:CRP-like cAMP-binding protein